MWWIYYRTGESVVLLELYCNCAFACSLCAKPLFYFIFLAVSKCELLPQPLTAAIVTEESDEASEIIKKTHTQ